MTHDEMIEVIKAHKEGKQLQCRPKPSGRLDYPWQDFRKGEEPVWNFQHVEYRVKPGPITVYARISSYGTVTDVVTTKEPAQYAVEKYGGRLVKLVEVPEE